MFLRIQANIKLLRQAILEYGFMVLHHTGRIERQGLFDDVIGVARARRNRHTLNTRFLLQLALGCKLGALAPTQTPGHRLPNADGGYNPVQQQGLGLFCVDYNQHRFGALIRRHRTRIHQAAVRMGKDASLLFNLYNAQHWIMASLRNGMTHNSMQNSKIRILTYNIHKGFNTGNRRFVLHQIRDQLRRADVDIVFLQEIQGEHTKRSERVINWPDASQFEFLADSIWPHYTYGKNAIYQSGHHGNAILSKHPFIHWENVNVSSLRQASRSFLHGVIEVNGARAQQLHLFCIHFDILSFERERQLNMLNQHITETTAQHEPLIIAGDFNDWHRRADRYLAKGLGLNEVFKQTQGRYARSYPAWMPMLPLDRIYFRNLQPTECSCLRHTPWHRLSDHAPLYASFNIGQSKK